MENNVAESDSTSDGRHKAQYIQSPMLSEDGRATEEGNQIDAVGPADISLEVGPNVDQEIL